jgi:hypothetical protein
MATKCFWSHKGVEAYAIILGETKKHTPIFPLGCSKNFDRHLMVMVCRMAIEIF